MDGVCHQEQGPRASKTMCAKVWCKRPFKIGTASTLVKGSEDTKGRGSWGGAYGDEWS